MGEGVGGTQRVSSVVKILYESIMMDTCHYTICPNPWKMYNTKRETQCYWTSGDYDVSM